MAWDKTKPDGGAPLKDGDDKIRLNNDHVQDALAREHEFPGTLGTTAGRHKFPTGNQTARNALANLVDGMIFGRSDAFCIDQRISGAWKSMVGYGVGTQAVRNGITSKPTPYHWFDTNSMLPAWWDGTKWYYPGAQAAIDQSSTETPISNSWTTMLKGGVDFELTLALKNSANDQFLLAAFFAGGIYRNGTTTGAQIRAQIDTGTGVYSGSSQLLPVRLDDDRGVPFLSVIFSAVTLSVANRTIKARVQGVSEAGTNRYRFNYQPGAPGGGGVPGTTAMLIAIPKANS